MANISLPQRLESHLGRQIEQERDQQVRNQALECPPISGMLIEHLKIRFDQTIIRQDHPHLAQLLMQQFGIDKVIKYLAQQYANQSEMARLEREV